LKVKSDEIVGEYSHQKSGGNFNALLLSLPDIFFSKRLVMTIGLCLWKSCCQVEPWSGVWIRCRL